MKPFYPFQWVAMDITEFTRGKKKLQHVLVFIDLFTKWVEVSIFTETPTAAQVAQAFYDNVVSRHGAPEFLVSDNGSNLNAQLVRDVCKLMAARHISISPYCPQTNGTVERFNQTFKNILALVAQERLEKWLEYVPAVLFAYRTAIHSATGDTTFFSSIWERPQRPVTLPPRP